MRILHVLAPAPFGGLERVVQDLSSAQQLAGHKVLVAAVGAAAGEVDPFLQGVVGREVEAEALLVSGRSYLAERKRLGGLFQRWSPDVLHTHGYRSDVVLGGVGRRAGLPTVATAHGFTSGGFKNAVYQWLQCRAYRRFSAVVAVAGSVAEQLERRGVPRERIHVVRNAVTRPDFSSPVEAREALGAPVGVFHVGWVGRFTVDKGPDLLLKALAKARRKEDLRVSFVGEGPLEAELLETVGKEGLGDIVRFLGPIDEASRLFKGFDLIAMSSRSEGTPMVLLEAMAAEVPVVATRVGGIPDVVSDSEALLVPADDSRAFARALDSAVNDRSALAERARKALRRFEREAGLEAWVDGYDRVYMTRRA